MNAAVSTLWISIVRTVTPIVVGAVLGWATSRGITVDPELEGALTAFLSAVFAALYFVVSRLLEVYVAPRLGWLLLSPKQPVYPKPADAQSGVDSLDRVPGADHRA